MSLKIFLTTLRGGSAATALNSKLWVPQVLSTRLNGHSASPSLDDRSHWMKEIRRNTIISRDHLTPSIPLHLITRDCEIYHQRHLEEAKTFPDDPFWGFYWPGGQAVSRFIKENPETVTGKFVLDIGSGCGASAIAAMKAGAKKVMANDIDKAEMNAELNEVQISTNCTNWLDMSFDEVPFPDVILIGDLCYDSEFSKVLFEFLQRMRRERDVEIIVGDPGRHGMTQDILRHMQPLTRYQLTATGVEENHGFGVAYVYRFL